MSGFRWRTVDIVVASIIAVAFGVIFWAWGLLWFGPFSVAFSGFPPAAGVVNGIWFIPAVLAPLIIRKPGAALYAELVAAIVSMLLGSSWGWLLFWYGVLQGLGGELAFAACGQGRTRRVQRLLGGRLSDAIFNGYGPVSAAVSGALAGLGATVLDPTTSSYAEMQGSWQIAYSACQIACGELLAGVGSLLLANGLAGPGVVDWLRNGRVRELV
jgi:energy-coupling factor transport system substrate-specific component